MRQIWRIGWTNNFMRHVVACFLVAYLRINWVEGLQWFSATLLDFDVSISSMMWQNAGMSGGLGKGSKSILQ
jgi:deoxyribodipyrimidine photo-lyase